MDETNAPSMAVPSPYVASAMTTTPKGGGTATANESGPVAPTPPPTWMANIPIVGAIAANRYARERRNYEWDVSKAFQSQEMKQKEQQFEANRFYQQQQMYVDLVRQRDNASGDLDKFLAKESETYNALAMAKQALNQQVALNPNATPAFLSRFVNDVQVAQARWEDARSVVGNIHARTSTIDDAMSRLIPAMRPPTQAMPSSGDQQQPTQDQAPSVTGQDQPVDAAPVDPYAEAQRVIHALGLPTGSIKDGVIEVMSDDPGQADKWNARLKEYSDKYGVSLPVNVIDRAKIMDQAVSDYWTGVRNIGSLDSRIAFYKAAEKAPDDIAALRAMASAPGIDPEDAQTFLAAAEAPEKERRAILASARAPIEQSKATLEESQKLNKKAYDFAQAYRAQRMGLSGLMSESATSKIALPAPSGMTDGQYGAWWLKQNGFNDAKAMKPEDRVRFATDLNKYKSGG